MTLYRYKEEKMATQKIARQGLTARHIGVVVTMALTLFTAVGIIFVAAGLCYRPVAEHFNVPTVSYTHLRAHETS